MLPTVLICAITCLTMIMAILFFPKLKLGKVVLDTYWLITLAGALLLILSKMTKLETIGAALVADTAINPLKILVLFISMTILSVYLDELGFFRFLANATLKKAGTSQKRLFFLLYLIVSVLTVFTSNDIIILSFTPFICYFAKHANISPFPYIAAEFVAANTWSMALIIGNPTNVYLATAAGSNFIEYVKVMILPTLASGAVALVCLYLLFHKKLSTPVQAEIQDITIQDKLSLWVGILHLGICTVLMAVGSYIGWEMWAVSFGAVISLCLFNAVISIVRKRAPKELGACLKRAPWPLIPFILSMFVMIISLNGAGVTALIGDFLGSDHAVFKYGVSSFVASNLINNIPMSVLFSSILESFEGGNVMQAVYATVVGSNLGACLTPIGALAGIMWGNILRQHNLKFGYLDFLKIGLTVAIPALAAALLVLQILF